MHVGYMNARIITEEEKVVLNFSVWILINEELLSRNVIYIKYTSTLSTEPVVFQ